MARLVSPINPACGDPHNMDGVADHVSGAALAFRTLRLIANPILSLWNTPRAYNTMGLVVSGDGIGKSQTAQVKYLKSYPTLFP